MMASVGDSKIFVPFRPTLLQLASMKMATLLYNNFGWVKLQLAHERIEQGVSIENCEDTISIEERKAQENFLLIPDHLRKDVLEAAYGLYYEIWEWRFDHADIFLPTRRISNKGCFYYLKSDGTLDRVKTAQQVVRNANIDITQRFDIACTYCLEERVQTLWTEMQASHKTKDLETGRNSMVRFWVERMHGRRLAPWTQHASEYFGTHFPDQVPRLSAIFSSLRPEQRKNFLSSLRFAKLGDLELCLYAMNKEEEEEMLEQRDWCPLQILRIFLRWPLRGFFLQTIEKMWKYMDENCFCDFLKDFFAGRPGWKEFDSSELFEEFWNRTPDNLRERAKESVNLREKIDSCLSTIRSKRKAEFERRNSIKKRRNLQRSVGKMKGK